MAKNYAKAATTLSRAEKLYIKMQRRLPHGRRPSRVEVADFLNVSTKTVRKIEKANGPKFTKWELERLQLERHGYMDRQLRYVEEAIAHEYDGHPADEMIRLRDEDNAPYANIALRFDKSVSNVITTIRYRRQWLADRKWGYVDKPKKKR